MQFRGTGTSGARHPPRLGHDDLAAAGSTSLACLPLRAENPALPGKRNAGRAVPEPHNFFRLGPGFAVRSQESPRSAARAAKPPGGVRRINREWAGPAAARQRRLLRSGSSARFPVGAPRDPARRRRLALRPRAAAGEPRVASRARPRTPTPHRGKPGRSSGVRGWRASRRFTSRRATWVASTCCAARRSSRSAVGEPAPPPAIRAQDHLQRPGGRWARNGTRFAPAGFLVEDRPSRTSVCLAQPRNEETHGPFLEGHQIDG